MTGSRLRISIHLGGIRTESLRPMATQTARGASGFGPRARLKLESGVNVRLSLLTSSDAQDRKAPVGAPCRADRYGRSWRSPSEPAAGRPRGSGGSRLRWRNLAADVDLGDSASWTS